MAKPEPLIFRAYITPKQGHLLVTILSPALLKPLYRSYPADIDEAAAVEMAVARAAALLTALVPAPAVRVTWQGVL